MATSAMDRPNLSSRLAGSGEGLSPVGRWIGNTCVFVVMCVLLLAGLAKAYDCSDFAQSLSTWSLLPAWSHGAIAVGMPMLEIAVAGLWLARVFRSAAQWAAGLLLFLFCGLLATELLLGRPPECHCFGVLMRYKAGRSGAEASLIRDGILLVLLLLGCVLNSTPRRGPARIVARAAGPRRGFTISELLLVISILVLLISLLIPALDQARERRYDAGSLSNLRQHVMVFDSYSNDANDYFPSFVTPRVGSYAIVRFRDKVYKVGYLSQTTIWNGLMSEKYYGGRANHPSFFSPDDYPGADRDSDLWDSSYYYSTTCLTDYRSWRPETRTGPDQWRVQMRSQVQFPVFKGLFLQMSPALYNLQGYWYRAAFMDGHAQRRRTDDFFPAQIGDVEFMSAPSPWPVLHTKDGVRGRDLRD